MTYKILSSRQADITLITMVEYNLDGTIITQKYLISCLNLKKRLNKTSSTEQLLN